MNELGIDWAALEAELEVLAFEALDGRPATPASAASVRRVLEARLRRLVGGQIRGLEVQVQVQDPTTIAVDVGVDVGDRVRRVRVRAGAL